MKRFWLWVRGLFDSWDSWEPFTYKHHSISFSDWAAQYEIDLKKADLQMEKLIQMARELPPGTEQIVEIEKAIPGGSFIKVRVTVSNKGPGQ